MNLYREAIEKNIAENEFRADSLTTYKKSYETLIETLKYFEEKFSPSILVPVCPKLFVRGKLIHTNEILVSLGCDYFLNCSTKHAIGIAERRINKSEELLKETQREYDYLTGQIEFKHQVTEESGQEIIEKYDEEAEKKWKVEHRKKMKEYRKQENTVLKNTDNGEIMNKLEYLQLQEEIENMYSDELNKTKQIPQAKVEEIEKAEHNYAKEVEKEDIDKVPNEKLDRKSIKKKLEDLRKNRKTKVSTEDDVLQRLNELEQEEYYEDLLEMCSEEETETDDSEEETPQSPVPETKGKRKVSFVDSFDDDTLVINFSHSSEPSAAPSESKPGVIQSPADIYKVYSKSNGPKSIIKNCDRVKDEIHHSLPNRDDEDVQKKSVYIGNILEKVCDKTEEIVLDNSMTRPISKFKAARLASKQKQ